MKKILFLLLICIIKLNAYEFSYLYRNQGYKYYFSNQDDNTLKVKMFYPVDGSVRYMDISIIQFQSIKNGHYSPEIIDNSTTGNLYIASKYFIEYYKNDLVFLNDLYVNSSYNFKQGFLNFLYNKERFDNENYIKYENYQILYNDEGYAVESIVGGVWKGLYDTPENSGYLYDQANNILYNNGEVASLFQRFWFALTGNVSKTLKVYYISMLSLNVFILIVAVYLVKVILGLIIKWISTIINNTKVNVNLGAQKRW